MFPVRILVRSNYDYLWHLAVFFACSFSPVLLGSSLSGHGISFTVDPALAAIPVPVTQLLSQDSFRCLSPSALARCAASPAYSSAKQHTTGLVTLTLFPNLLLQDRQSEFACGAGGGVRRERGRLPSRGAHVSFRCNNEASRSDHCGAFWLRLAADRIACFFRSSVVEAQSVQVHTAYISFVQERHF